MNSPDGPVGLLDFARDFIRDIDRHQDVRPSFEELWSLGDRLGVHFSRPPAMPAGLPGANIWRTGSAPAILLNDDLSRQRAETTFGHELREVIENAFKKVKPSYLGLNTSDNRSMNPESNQFAGCLLMQAAASRAHLEQAGFDFPTFATGLGRSLSSTVLRSRQLYPASHPEPGPAAGVWLFEAPWETVRSGTSTPADLRLRYFAHLSGFSARKNGTDEQALARHVFPARGSSASQFQMAVHAIEQRRPVIGRLGGFDLFGERDFVVGAEPFFANGVPWRVLLLAARRDGQSRVEP